MIIDKLKEIWSDIDQPFLQEIGKKDFFFNEIINLKIEGLEQVNSGDVIGLIGDFDPYSISTLLKLLNKGAIVVPLSKDTFNQHDYFLKESLAQMIFENGKLIRLISNKQESHPLLSILRKRKHPGLILFTTGTTGRPKAILHDFLPFIERYKTPRPPLRALSFLLFDHIGGLNTLLHMLFNQGNVVSIKNRSVEEVLKALIDYQIELLPTTPTFLRMITLYPNIEKYIPNSLKIISYGTERMDQPTLNLLNKKFPNIDFRQTYGMSELGILRVSSKSKNSLFMKIGGEGVETKIINNVLFIRAKNRMLGYLNSESPFDEDDWYCTKDLVEKFDNEFIKIIGRDNEIINVGGLKFMPSEVEIVALNYKGIKYAKAIGGNNPITGQHVELTIELNKQDINIIEFKKFLTSSLPRHMRPLKLNVKELKISHRFKKL